MVSYLPLLPAELQSRASERRRLAPQRWDGRDLQAYDGRYGDFVLSKVSMVFPQLAKGVGVRAS